jgi:hypothetical protein
MGLLIQNNNIELTNGAGVVKFTTSKQMPHLLYGLSGSINVATVTGSRYYGEGTDYNGNPTSGYYGFLCNETQDFVIATGVAVQEAGSFFMPFFSFNAGDFNTEAGATSGAGSTILRFFIDPGGFYRGVMVLSPVVVGNSVILRVKTTIKEMAGGFSGYPFINDTGPTVQLANTALTIGYRVYYGRYA